MLHRKAIAIAALSFRGISAFTPTSVVSRKATAYNQLHRQPNSRKMATATDQLNGRTKISFNSDLVDLVNKQITNEFIASQLYLSASLWCESMELDGMAAYFRSESEDERSHALTIIDYANKRDFPITLQTLNAPPSNWNSVQHLWEDLLYAEQDNTQALRKVADVAVQCGDHATQAFLLPYHTEQVDSEDKLKKMIAKIKEEKETPGLLRQLDASLSEEAGAA